MDESTALENVNEALELANAAASLDKSQNYSGACDYYDLTILTLNELLPKLPKDSDAYSKLVDLRAAYNERLMELSDTQTPSYNFANIGSGLLGSSTSSSSTSSSSSSVHTSGGGGGGSQKAAGAGSRKQRRASHIAFEYEFHPTTTTTTTSSSTTTTTGTETETGTGDETGGGVDPRVLELEKPPASVVLQSYWQLRTIGRSIRTGCFITNAIFVPTMVWTQPGAKLSGLAAKMTALEHVNATIDQFIAPLQVKATLSSLDSAVVAFQSMQSEFTITQNTLAKSFPYIAEVPVEEENAPPASSGGIRSVFGALGSMAKGMKKLAEVGYSRLGALSVRVTEEDFASYASLVSSLCDRSHLLAVWYEFTNNERDKILRSGSVSGSGGDEMARVALMETLLVCHIGISSFMREVVCELLLRDLEVLLQRHLRKMNKSHMSMYFDDVDDDE
jgi:hypothetical protein